MPLKVREAEEVKRLTPPNADLVSKPEYNANVDNQVRMTSESYQDYYAKYHEAMEKAGITGEDKAQFMILASEALVTAHKGGDRLLKALNEDGKNWKNSKHLKNSDKVFLGYAQKNLGVLKNIGISFENSEQEVKAKIRESFGQMGDYAVRVAEAAPLYGEVITDKEKLQKGDRVLSNPYESGEVFAIRGGNSAATAILYMTTFMTCQGVSVPGAMSVEKFMEIAKTQGNDAFSTSSDEKGLKKAGVSDDRIEKLKKQGMYAIGLAMFSKGRFDDMSAYYVMQDQLDCTVSVCAMPSSLVQGNAPGDLVIAGGVSIRKEESDVDRGGNKPICVEVFHEGEKVYEATPITAPDGTYVVKIPKAEVDKFPHGEYLVSATHDGVTLGEELSCGGETSVTIEKAPVKEKKPEFKGIPLKVSVTVSPRRRVYREDLPVNEDGREIGDKQYRSQVFKLKIAKAEGAAQGVSFIVTVNATENWVKKTRSRTSVMNHYEQGWQIGYSKDIPFSEKDKINLEGRLGVMFGESAADGGVLAGMDVAYGDPKKLGRFAVTFGTDVGRAIHEALVNPGEISGGVKYMRQLGNLSAEIEVTDLKSKKPYTFFTIGYKL